MAWQHSQRGPGGRFQSASEPPGDGVSGTPPGIVTQSAKRARRVPLAPQKLPCSMPGRGQRHKRWSDTIRDQFLKTLAATLNVKAAARAAGWTPRSFYDRRKRDEQFRLAWQEAIDEGYVRIEEMLLDRALNGQRKQVVVKGELIETIEYSDALALNLLANHRRAVAEYRAALPPTPPDAEVLRQRLIDKVNTMIASMRDREARGDAGGSARGEARGGAGGTDDTRGAGS